MRQTKEVTITAEGRDHGRKYLITEMTASQAERWAFRALSAMASAGYDLPPDFAAGGMAVISLIGLKSILSADFDKIEPLLGEMMDCVQSVQAAATRPLVEDDIEEVATRVRLRDEVFELHVGFSIAAALSNLAAAAQAAGIGTSRNTPTSAEPSE